MFLLWGLSGREAHVPASLAVMRVPNRSLEGPIHPPGQGVPHASELAPLGQALALASGFVPARVRVLLLLTDRACFGR